jgi:hypothetical protein
MGSFIYKYQLLYAMDHGRNSTGGAWPIICNRIIVGLVVFQLAMIGQLAGLIAIRRAVLLVPLLFGTIWFIYFYRKTYEPLMKFIALRSLLELREELVVVTESQSEMETRERRAVYESGARFINPNLIAPLEGPWLSTQVENGNGEGHLVNGSGDERV